MARARRDQNYVTTLIGVSFDDLETPVELALDPVNNRLLVSALITTDTSKTMASAWDDTTDPTLIYVGKAAVDSDDTDAVWQIAKIDTSSGRKTWADAASFTQVWDDRVGLTYQ